jgi:hypothetical protein
VAIKQFIELGISFSRGKLQLNFKLPVFERDGEILKTLARNQISTQLKAFKYSVELVIKINECCIRKLSSRDD